MLPKENRGTKCLRKGEKKMENKKSLLDEELNAVSGGMIVDDGDGTKFWLVRQNGTVISPVPGLEKAEDFVKAYGESTKVISREEYKKLFGRDLVW